MIQANQAVKILGRYLYNNIDSAYEFKSTTNIFDVYMLVFYEIPELSSDPTRRKGRTGSKLYEMKLDINITTYQNKVRVNLIVVDDRELTLDFQVYDPELVQDLPKLKDKVLKRIRRVLTRTFSDYEFIF